MPIADLLARGRARHEQLMLDTIRIEKPGTPTTGPDGTATRTPVTLYTGKARVKPVAVGVEEAEAGGRETVLRGYLVQLPYTATASEVVKIGHTIVITASPDPRMVGRRLAVTAERYSSTATCWHIPAETQS